ncbi:glycosyl hydrolase family 28-related protein [Kribbella speibonae]|uniref:glycosyl hydrolase family 28-related protein n=1 Tax=Kribbella speibonae TaxID=1572660 RepID=UPI00192DCBD9|nr:glycosyl hydrolase family 28-related protein [Kribbella speibonae]
MLSRRTFTGLAAAAVAAPLLRAGVQPAAAHPETLGFRSAYDACPPDPTAVVLGSPGFEVGPDATAGLQAAVDEASRRGISNQLGDILGGARDFPLGDGGGVVFVPPGTYSLSAPINVHDSVRIIGFGRRRPRFVLAPNSPGYAGPAPRVSSRSGAGPSEVLSAMRTTTRSAPA